MPNSANIQEPLLVVGTGRTASTYLIHQLRISLYGYQSIIENEAYLDVYDALRKKWWADAWKWVAEDAVVEERILQSIREMLITLFPSEHPHWAMKTIWNRHKPEVLGSLFPKARFIHLVRDPRTNIPSIIERIGWSEEKAQEMYVSSNQAGLAFTCFGDRYLRIRQEEFVDARLQTWQRICEFLGAGFNEGGDWEAEENTAASTAGKTGEKRSNSRLSWDALDPKVQAMAEQLGYGPGVQPTTTETKTLPGSS